MLHGYYRRGSCYVPTWRNVSPRPPVPSSDLNGAPLQAHGLRLRMGCARRMPMRAAWPIGQLVATCARATIQLWVAVGHGLGVWVPRANGLVPHSQLLLARRGHAGGRSCLLLTHHVREQHTYQHHQKHQERTTSCQVIHVPSKHATHARCQHPPTSAEPQLPSTVTALCLLFPLSTHWLSRWDGAKSWAEFRACISSPAPDAYA